MASVQSILQTASQYLGTNDFNNYCEAFVEQVTQGKTGIYPSAIQAWISQQKNAVPGTNGIQPGDTIYFSPNQSNNGYGHTGIYIGNGQFISATYNGVKTANLSSWQQSTGQQILGYIPTGQNGAGAQIAQNALSNGKMLSDQLSIASQTPDNQIPALLQRFQAQQHIAQSENILNQRQQNDQAFLNTNQQAPIPNVPSNPGTGSQAPTFPYAKYLNNPSQTLPNLSSPTAGQSATPTPTTSTPTTLPTSSPQTNLSTPQANLNPAQQPTSHSFGPITVTT